MGLYIVECPVCKKLFYWFSGNIDQRCGVYKMTDDTQDSSQGSQKPSGGNHQQAGVKDNEQSHAQKPECTCDEINARHCQVHQEPERQAKYWICDNCARANGWECIDAIVTCIRGLCGWCERKDETFLTPTCDFNGPNGKRAIYD